MDGTGLLILIGLIALYFVPTIMAYRNDKANKVAITLLNIFLGWTVLGWIVALIWAAMKDKVAND